MQKNEMILSNEEFLPYKNLASAIIIDAKKEVEKNQTSRGQEYSRQSFLFLKDREAMAFWCQILALDPVFIMDGINKKLGHRKAYGVEKPRRKSRVRLSAKMMGNFLMDMKSLVPMAILKKKYPVSSSSCFYHAKKNKISMRTSAGIYRP